MTELASQPVIEFSGVHKYYGNLHVLRGIDLAVAAGEKIVLIGASGCGKSTLLRCINALDKIDDGLARVNGENIGVHGFDLNRFRSNIGFVFQQFNLFPHLTVIQNITLGPVKVKNISKVEAQEQARALLKRVGILEKAEAYPESLSGGQQQRVAIARSLAMNPKLILLDEPTSALDPQMTREVLSVIEDISAQDMTVLIVTHELAFAKKVASRVLFMHEGKIEEDGHPDDLFQRPQKPATQAYLNTL